MRKVLFGSLVCLLALGLAGAAQAVLIDFETVAQGSYASLTIGEVTFTPVTIEEGYVGVTEADPGEPISGQCLLSYPYPLKATFAVPALMVKMGVGDYNEDYDDTYLEAYDAGGNLLVADHYLNPAEKYGGDYLQVLSATPIAYVIIRSEGDFPNSLYWDNFEYTLAAVPLPGAFLLVASGLLGMLSFRRKRD